MTDIAKSIAEAKCLGSLVAIDTAHKAGDLTDAEKDRLLSGLVPMHEAHNREVAELVRLVCTPPRTGPLPPSGVPLLIDETFDEGWRDRWGIYGRTDRKDWFAGERNAYQGTPPRNGIHSDEWVEDLPDGGVRVVTRKLYRPDGTRMLTTHGDGKRPAWSVAQMSKRPNPGHPDYAVPRLPQFFEAHTEMSFDADLPGIWLGPFVSALDGGAGLSEVDIEHFGDFAQRMRFTFWLRFDGEAAARPRYSFEVRRDDIGARAWWGMRTTPDGKDGMRIEWLLDGAVKATVTTTELAAKHGRTAAEFMRRTAAGWMLHLTVHANGNPPIPETVDELHTDFHAVRAWAGDPR